MEDIGKLQRQLKKLLGEVKALTETAEKEDRNFEDWENDEYSEKMAEINRLKARIKRFNEPANEAIKPQVSDNDGQPWETVSGTARIGENRSYQKLFDSDLSNNGWGSFAEFAVKVARNLPDERLQRSLQEAVPGEGGYLVPTEFSRDLFDVGLQSELVRPRAKVYPVGQANKLIVPATVIGDHSSNLYGGVTTAWGGEGATLSESAPKFRDIELTPYKLHAYFVGSSEWFADVANAETILREQMSGAIGWRYDKDFITGTGAGQPLGIFNSGCLLEVAKEDGQTAGTVCSENIFKMWAAMHPACHSKSVWVCHPDVLPQLFSMSIAVGTGGSAWFVPAGGASPYNTLLGRPVLVNEHMEPLGDAGDILLADFSQYFIGMRKELSIDTSMHVHFATDKIAIRAITRLDGQPAWDEPLTLADGAKQVSPFVILAERA